MRSGSFEGGKTCHHCPRPCQKRTCKWDTAKFVRSEGALYGYGPSERTEDQVIDGDYQKEYSACQLKVGDLDVKYMGQYRFAGESEYQQDRSAYDHSGVERFLALTVGYVIGDAEKHRYIADGIDYCK